MTEEQIQLLRSLIKQEIDCAQIDGMDHGSWGWAEQALNEGWQRFADDFKNNQLQPQLSLQMTHPSPPAELIEDWIVLAKGRPQSHPDPNKLAALAAEWGYKQGADTELEECCKWFHRNYAIPTTQIRKERRPKPQILKENG